VRARILFLTLVTALAVSVATAGASRQRPAPIPVQSSSLTQEAQDLLWRVDMSQPFSPAGLGVDRRSLCLLLERLKSGSVAGQLCVAGPAPGGHAPRLIYQPITSAGPGLAREVVATVTRSGDQALTATFTPASIGWGYHSLRWQVISTLRPPACVPAVPDPVGCLTLFPPRPALAELHTPQLVGCVPSGSAFVDDGSTSRRVIALTFDDGPWYDTPQFLDILERYHVPATFFEIGDQISTYGDGGAIERRMLADGDMIGDHTWNHRDIAGAGSFAAGEISQAAAAIRQATGGFEPCLLRAPYGDVSPALISEARSMGFTTIQWDIDPRDWSLPGVSAIYDNVIANAHPGAIVIQHDGGGNRSETLAALPQEIQTLRSRGYQLVTVTQLLGQRLIYR
jgi:peptidoglycan-N-acetylglucosamine deacetylase